jgi:hypothetical protein
MGYYAVSGKQTTLTSGLKGAVATWTNTTGLRRHKWYELIIGAASNPNATDTYVQVDVSRLTATTSLAGTSFTANPLDPADGVAIALALVNITTEPNSAIIGTQLMQFGLNQRNTTRWIAAQESQYFVAPATNLNGLYSRLLSNALTTEVDVQLYFME